MPAVSKSQQRLMGQAYAYKKGELKKKDIDPKYIDEIKKLAKSMDEDELRRYASTKHEGLPEEKNDKNENKQFIKKFNEF